LAKTPLKNEKFGNLLIAVVDKTLSCLGEEPKSAIYFHLENVLNLPKHEIPSRIDEFSNGLEGLLGSGAKILENSFIKNIYSEVGILGEFEGQKTRIVPGSTFKQYVSFAEKFLENARQNEEQTSNSTEENSSLTKDNAQNEKTKKWLKCISD
jgi:hypothetical protein